MITDEQLKLIEMTLEQPVDDIVELVQRATSLHGNCVALLDEVKRQRTLLAMGVRLVVTPTSTSTGTNADSARIPVAEDLHDASRAPCLHDASVPAGERLARLTAALKEHDRDRMECANHDAACDPAGCHDVTVSRYEHEARIALSIAETAALPTVEQLTDAGPTDHGQMCPKWIRRGVVGSGPCTCWIRSTQAPRLAARVHALLFEQAQS